jgi:hypothetical protein
MAGTIKKQPAFKVTRSLKMRFAAKVTKVENGCHIWTGTIQRHGYGAIKIEDRKIDAHVASWRIANGGIAVPVGMLIRHTCNCRQCVNPKHLKCGTHAENMQDAIQNGRGEFMPRGEEVWNSVLTDRLVKQIRRMHQPGKVGARAIGKKLGLHESTVAGVLKGRTWKHVESEVA